MIAIVAFWVFRDPTPQTGGFRCSDQPSSPRIIEDMTIRNLSQQSYLNAVSKLNTLSAECRPKGGEQLLCESHGLAYCRPTLCI